MQQPQPTATDSCWKAIVADLSQRPNLREVRLPIPKARLEPMNNGH